jgi:drug/metabolite transporter (DMT)-like permease
MRLMLASALCFSVMGALVKQASLTLPSQEILLARMVVNVALSLAVLRHRGLSLRGGPTGRLILRGVLGTISLACLFYGISHLPFAAVTVIQHTSPIFTALFAAVFLRERVGGSIVVAAVACLAGVGLMVGPGQLLGGPALDPLAVGVALCCAIASASVYVTVRGMREVHPDVIVAYFALVAVPLVAPLALRDWVWPDAGGWLLVLGVGVASQLAQTFMTRGLHLEAAARATAMNYMQIVFNVVLGVVVFAEWPPTTTFLGAAIVVASTLAVTRRTAPPAA